MNVFKLAAKEHDKNLVTNLTKKCIDVIETCENREQFDSARSYIDAAHIFVYAQEHLDEYSGFKLWLVEKINGDKRHRKFKEQVASLFELLRMRLAIKISDYEHEQ